MEVRLRPSALQDLREVVEYIWQENSSAALRIVDEVEIFCLTSLSENPRMGADHSTIYDGLHFFPLAGYRICYFIREDHVDVVRILHQARDVAKHLRG